MCSAVSGLLLPQPARDSTCPTHVTEGARAHTVTQRHMRKHHRIHMYTPLQPSWCSWGGEHLGAKGPEAGTSLAEEHLPGQDAKGLRPVWGSMWLRRVKAGRSRGRGRGSSGGGWEPGEEDGRAPGQREAGHRQRNGGRHTGGLGQGPGQGAVLVPHTVGCISLSPHLQKYS